MRWICLFNNHIIIFRIGNMKYFLTTYKRRLKKFFNFIEFETIDQDIEYRFNKFLEKSKKYTN
jgi:hypothetical protein